MHASCGCTTSEVDSLRLAQGGTTRVRVSITPPDAIPFSGAVFVQTNDAKIPALRLSLRANPTWPIETDPKSFYFPSLAASAIVKDAFTVFSGRGLPFKVLKVRTTAPCLTVTEDVGIATGRRRYHFKLAPVTMGSFNERVVLFTYSPLMPKIEIPVLGEVLGAARVSPPRVLLGLQRPGDSKRVQLRILASSMPTKVVVQTEGAGWSVTDASFSKATAGALTVSFMVRTPRLPGFHKGKLKIPYDGSTIDVPISCVVQ